MKDSGAGLAYEVEKMVAQSTAFQKLDQRKLIMMTKVGVVNVTLFNPSSTTFVKHFMTMLQITNITDGSIEVIDVLVTVIQQQLLMEYSLKCHLEI
jgi:spore coat protein CotF